MESSTPCGEIKKEDIDLVINQEEVCFELIKIEQNCLNEEMYEENVLKKEKDINKEADETQQIKMIEFTNVRTEEEMEDVWTESTGHVPDPLALCPTVDVNVETQSTIEEYTSTTRACPDTSQEIGMLFLCGKCGSKCTQIDEYHDHIKICSHSITSTLHLGNSTGESNHFKGTRDVNSHVKLPTGKPYKCKECDYSASLLSDLKTHSKIHYRKKLYTCSQCDYTVSKSWNLKRHTIKMHNREKLYKCTECDYAASQTSHLKTHMTVHTGEKLYKCADCNYTTSRRSDLYKHKSTHTGEKPYKCTECDYSTARQNDVQRHMVVHTETTRYKCKECEYTSSRRNELLKHMREHKKPLNCTECKYTALRRNDLERHFRVHTGDKPYPCTLCDYSASLLGTLKAHMTIHTGIKPYKCTECNFSASVSINVKRHLRERHSINL